jgi:uncharacterized protein (DUF2236 family)
VRADDGYFGPSSVAWRVHGDFSGFLGGGRAMLIQALHPVTMAVFERNTSYEEDPWGRLRRTAGFFVAVIYGDRATADRASERLRAIHARMTAVDPDTGRLRRADDPDLLLWVHATAVDSFIESYRRFAGRLSDADADGYVAEMVTFAELVGLRRDEVPASRGELAEYLAGVRGLRVTPGARAGMRMMLFFPPVPLVLRPAWSVVTAGLVSLLPRWARRMYGLPWLRAADPPVRATVFALSQVLNRMAPLLPPVRPFLEAPDWRVA